MLWEANSCRAVSTLPVRVQSKTPSATSTPALVAPRVSLAISTCRLFSREMRMAS